MKSKAADNCFLIEDHHEALKVWRKRGVKDVDLVHVDAHIDFGFHPAKPFLRAVSEAKNIKDLKTSLERSLAFSRSGRDFDSQTNIANYIYPAMRDGIIRNFYWVIPGGEKEFGESRKLLRILIGILAKHDPVKNRKSTVYGRKVIKTSLMGRKFIITTLRSLPPLNGKVLLDIDTDFLVIPAIKNTRRISIRNRRKPWILPKEFVKTLRKKIKRPEITTIAYSVNGGFVPMKHRHLGDEIAYYFSPGRFDTRFRRNSRAAEYFNLFDSTQKGEYYGRAVRLNPAYRAPDNNYGFLYARLGKFTEAKKEFFRIIKVDAKNPYALSGLGSVYLQKRDYRRAKRYFRSALRQKKDLEPAVLGLAYIKKRR